MADRPLRPATRRCLGRPLPHQLADKPRAHPTAQRHFLKEPCGSERISGINPSFPGLSRSVGQVAHVLLTRSPLRHTDGLPLRCASLDLHALGAPPAFVLSQDQTLQRTFTGSVRRRCPLLSSKCLQLGLGSVRDPRASIAAMPTTRPTNRPRWQALAGFWHIVQLSRSPNAPTAWHGQADDQIADPLHTSIALSARQAPHRVGGQPGSAPGPDVE